MNAAIFVQVKRQVGYLLFKKNYSINFQTLRVYFFRHSAIFLLFAAYLFIRLYHLTLLPMYNDESIYLRWGWMEIHSSASWYLSLYDGKQPLLMWIFGYAQTLFPDSLYAGRLVSVITGFVTLLGIYQIGLHFFSRKVALLAGLFYTVLGIFVLYDRQALMESSISMIGIWSCYFFLRLLEKPKIIFAVLFGVIIGIGLFDKSDAGIFLVNAVILGFVTGISNARSSYRYKLFLLFSLSFFVCFLVLIPLLMQKDFYTIISRNYRYSYSLSDVFYNFFPIVLKNVPSTFSLLWGYLTPIPFMLAISGIVFFLRSQNKAGKVLVSWFSLSMLAFILFTVNPSDRYIVAFLPVAVFFCAYAIVVYADKFARKYTGIVLTLGAIIIPSLFTFVLLFSPVNYFSLLHVLMPNPDMGFVQGSISGYGLLETKDFLLRQAKKGATSVFVQNNSGNPQDAMYVYFGERFIHHITVYSVSMADVCTRSEIYHTEAYFVSRSNYINPSCMIPVKKFYKPVGNSYVGVYKIIP